MAGSSNHPHSEGGASGRHEGEAHNAAEFADLPMEPEYPIPPHSRVASGFLLQRSVSQPTPGTVAKSLQHRRWAFPEELGSPSFDDAGLRRPTASREVKKPRKLPRLFEGLEIGVVTELPQPTVIADKSYTHVCAERDFNTASGARLLKFTPGDTYFVFKKGNLEQEAIAMACLRRMNDTWQEAGLRCSGQPVQILTYAIVPLSSKAGLVEFVAESWNMRELAVGYTQEDRHLRILHKLQGRGYDSEMLERLDRLAATAVAYLTAIYGLGVRDSHDENIMLREDGALFRVDFGFMFGDRPNIDAPLIALPRAVAVALGEARWTEVVSTCEKALLALSGPLDREPPAWKCISSVAELAPLHSRAHAHVQALSMQAFQDAVKHAHEWSFSRAVKNKVREVIRFFAEPTAAPADNGYRSSSKTPLGQSPAPAFSAQSLGLASPLRFLPLPALAPDHDHGPPPPMDVSTPVRETAHHSLGLPAGERERAAGIGDTSRHEELQRQGGDDGDYDYIIRL
eukprot:TRINITY_DN51376_c0_g1_i1.p1 TRINITY_DN51376_c0_g1~~TRINITY_DN51376_c0_g1_i1.p1  ORF type:complete len:513 (-),score=80.31 TRINITY_DN51376_c0_g1_i1:469-2007(-)